MQRYLVSSERSGHVLWLLACVWIAGCGSDDRAPPAPGQGATNPRMTLGVRGIAGASGGSAGAQSIEDGGSIEAGNTAGTSGALADAGLGMSPGVDPIIPPTIVPDANVSGVLPEGGTPVLPNVNPQDVLPGSDAAIGNLGFDAGVF